MARQVKRVSLQDDANLRRRGAGAFDYSLVRSRLSQFVRRGHGVPEAGVVSLVSSRPVRL